MSRWYEYKALVTFSPASFGGLYVLGSVVQTQEEMVESYVLCLHCPFKRDLNSGFQVMLFEMRQHSSGWVCE